jgi:DNA-binding protein H-NS
MEQQAMPTSKELRAQAADLIKQAEELEKKELEDARTAIFDLIRESGLTPEDIFGKGSKGLHLAGGQGKNKGANKQKSPVTPQFRNPENPEETWTGRGRAPRWMEGKDKEEFRIKAEG